MIATIALMGALIGVELARDNTNPFIVAALVTVMLIDMFSLSDQIEKLRHKNRGHRG